MKDSNCTIYKYIWWWWIVSVVWLPDERCLRLTSSQDHCQRFSPSHISDNPPAGFEPAQNLSSDFVEWSCAVVITATPFFTCFTYDKGDSKDYWIFRISYLKVNKIRQWLYCSSFYYELGCSSSPCRAKPNLERVTHFKKWQELWIKWKLGSLSLAEVQIKSMNYSNFSYF